MRAIGASHGMVLTRFCSVDRPDTNVTGSRKNRQTAAIATYATMERICFSGQRAFKPDQSMSAGGGAGPHFHARVSMVCSAMDAMVAACTVGNVTNADDASWPDISSRMASTWVRVRA